MNDESSNCRAVYAVAADGVSDSGHQLYTIHQKRVPNADNWKLFVSQPSEQPRGEASNQKLGRFGHHPDPAMDFCVEAECLIGELYNARVGFEKGSPSREDLDRRVSAALSFVVGGDTFAVRAKQQLRAALAQPKPEQAVGDGVAKPWRFDPSVANYEQYRERLRAMSPYRTDGRADDNLLADMILLLLDIERGWHLTSRPAVATPADGREPDECPATGRYCEFELGPADVRHCKYCGSLDDGASTPAEVTDDTREYVLRAMAENYSEGHSWDKLDAAACMRGADEIKALRDALTAQCQVRKDGGVTDRLLVAARACSSRLQILCDTRLRGHECAAARAEYHALNAAIHSALASPSARAVVPEGIVVDRVDMGRGDERYIGVADGSMGITVSSHGSLEHRLLFEIANALLAAAPEVGRA
ncbi:hypothetical protein [Luteibacter sp. SG786]|uniref:hypothetical protein n=1 Tax=Luteibacter sp. SG786 TaxID=2587130 RepID=UPI00141E7C23|nr:hypothetical protein [Luteibacter sp. SG786]NII53540.1 hypothetical protein [Luteibacter sp. SG786]